MSTVFSTRLLSDVVAISVRNPQKVDYVYSKSINLTGDASYENVEQFKDVVSFDNSSVHIPIDIFREGDLSLTQFICVFVTSEIASVKVEAN